MGINVHEINNQSALKKKASSSSSGKRNLSTEKALREVTERLNLALHAASMGTWSWDITADASIWDEHMWRLFGLPAHTQPTLMSHEDFLARIHGEDRESVRQEIFQRVKGSGSYHIEYRVVWPDGSVHWLAERGKLYRNELGEPARVTGVCWDVSERKENERALLEMTERLNLSLEAGKVGTWYWDVGSDEAIWDKYTAALMGFKAHKELRTNHAGFIACVHPEDRDIEMVKRDSIYALSDDKPFYFEYRVVWPDGSIHTIAERGKVYRNEFGEPIRVTGVCQDITEQKTAQEKLCESEQKFRSIVETTNEWIWAVDLEGYITYSNPTIEAILGYKAEELTGKHYLMLRHPEDRSLTPLVEMAAKKQAWTNKVIRTLHKDGSYRYLESSAVVILSPTGEVVGYRGSDRDITARINTEADLKELSERLTLALDAASVGIWCWDVQADKLEWDEHMKVLFALRAEVYSGTFSDFLDYVHPDDRNLMNLKTHRSIKGKENNLEFEHRIICPEGNIRVIATRGRIYRDEQGRAIRVAGASCDVTERRRAEQRLRDSEEKFRSIVETTNEWIWEIDAQGRHTYNNPALFRMLGYRPSEILGKTCLPYVHEDDKEWLAKSLPFHIETKTGWNNVIVRWRHKDGNYRYLESSAVPIISETGAVKGFRGADRDITLRRQVEQTLEELSERLNLALRAASMGTWSWNIAENKLLWDDYMYPLYDMEPGSFKGGYEEAMEAVYPEDREYIKQEISKAIHENMSFDIEHRVQWQDGTIHFIAARGKVYRNENDEAVRLTGVSWDITARKHTEQLGRQHQVELAHVARMNSMGEMASTLAHELNQPLAAIANYTKGCVRRLESGNFQLDQVLHAMRQAASQSERAGEIIHRMKNFVRKGKLYYEAADINKIIRDMAALINYEMREFPVNIQLELTEQIPHLPVDKVQIEQVILNLLRNAIEAMQDAKTAKPKLLVRTLMPSSDIMHVDVVDNGPGFSAEIAQQLLTPYFTTKPKGMGMGLAICRTIIEAHGGHLSARLNPEGGAWFQFTLPVTNIEIV